MNRFGHDAITFEFIKFPLVMDLLFAPDLAQQPNSFRQASDPLVLLDAESSHFSFMAAADTDSQDSSSFGKLIQARPLDRQQHRMAHGKARHANHPETNFLRARRHGAEHDDRIETRLVNQAVAEPDGFEDPRLFRKHGSLEDRIDIRETKQHPAIRQA